MRIIKRAFLKELYYNGIIGSDDCTEEENQRYTKMNDDELPDGIDVSGNDSSKFIKYQNNDLTEEQMKLFLLAKQNSNLRAIKRCIMFFVVLVIIGILLSCFATFNVFQSR